MKLLRIRLKEQSGIVAVVVALLLPALIGMLGLVFDLGVAFQYKRMMQTATDAGAFAGAIAILREEDSQLNTKVLYDAAKNGFDGSHGETRTINRPPVNGDFAGNNRFVEMIISQQLNTYFMPVLGIYDMTVSARAVAGVVASEFCVYVLNGTANKAFETSSDSTFLAPGCAVKVHSCDQEALSVTSNSTMTADFIEVCGQVNTSGSTVTPEPETQVCDGTPCDRGEDPLAYLADPVVPNGCAYTDFKTSSQGGAGNPYQIYAGTYCNGVSIESGSHVHFNPGIYYLKGGSLNIDSGSTATGFGVSFYNTETNDYSYKPTEIQSGSHVEFTAPSGTNTDFDGILFWQDRNISGNYDNKIESDTSSYFEGTFYFPTQHLMFHSNTIGGSAAGWTLLVVDTLSVTSGTSLTIRSNLTGSHPSWIPYWWSEGVPGEGGFAMIYWRRQSGTVSVEMAAMLPILIVLTLGAVDLGRLFYVTVAVANAARAGVSYGSLNKKRSKNLSKSDEFAHADADSVQGGVAVTATRFCECSDGSSVDCETGTCDEGSKSIYVRVRAWKTYETLLPYPGIPNSVAMVRDAYMQAGTR